MRQEARVEEGVFRGGRLLAEGDERSIERAIVGTRGVVEERGLARSQVPLRDMILGVQGIFRIHRITIRDEVGEDIQSLVWTSVSRVSRNRGH